MLLMKHFEISSTDLRLQQNGFQLRGQFTASNQRSHACFMPLTLFRREQVLGRSPLLWSLR